MHKYYKYIFTVLLAIIILPVATNAAASDVSLTSGTVIQVGSYVLTVDGSTAAIDTIAVDSTTFTVTMLAGSSITVNAASGNAGYSFGITGTTNYVTQCGVGYSLLTITGPSSGTETVVVTPSSTQCTVIGGGGGNSSSANYSSSGGGTVSMPTPTLVPTATPSVATAIPGCPVGYTCSPQVSPSSIKTSFTRRLIKGVSGNDVKNLQMILNSNTDTRIASTGAGSQGNETDFFGGLTLKAVQKFQIKYGIAKEGDESYGQVGPKTRAKLNELVK